MPGIGDGRVRRPQKRIMLQTMRLSCVIVADEVRANHVMRSYIVVSCYGYMRASHAMCTSFPVSFLSYTHQLAFKLFRTTLTFLVLFLIICSCS